MGTSFNAPWTRGQRGWGSVDPTADNGQSISLYQQNPSDQPVEAAADMFLNWVYRRTTDTAPTNISADPLSGITPQDTCNYAQTGNWMGFQNIDRTGASDTTKPGNTRYWWMESVMTIIFNQQQWR